jgi:transposase-like protein
MIRIPVPCPYCQSEQVMKGGKTNTWKQRYRCQNSDCSHQSFLLDSAYRGRLLAIKQQEIEVSLNGGGVCDTARVLKFSAARVIHELKKRAYTHRRQPAILKHVTPERCGHHPSR